MHQKEVNMKLPKTYEPSDYESDIYNLWETSGVFRPTGKGEPYSIIMPPPNANGNLHVGHAYMIPIEDILTRYHRMKGRDTIWIPGADHAGFETWVVFERALEKKGKSRFDFSREELYKMTWDFVQQNRGNMELQLRALGASCDWNSLTFTLDEKVVNTVYTTFKQLWDDELIYRGERIVNYCTVHRTSFADIEVSFKEEASHLWYIAYPLTEEYSTESSHKTPNKNPINEIIVATTRPETMLGDVAVAVHPDDEKYKHLVGKTVKLPLSDRNIPIIADDAIELGFGTGAVKITPAHDPLDFEIGSRHDLTPIQVIGLDGKITENAPTKYRNLSVDEARKAVVKDLEDADLIRKIDDFTHTVPHCYKCDSVIQPLLMKQWFINVQPLAQRAKKSVENGEIKFVPESKGRELAKYYDELRDWNISRQIPWGIPIPAFQNINDENDWIFDARVDQEQITINDKIYKRDNDTFDTWFSSGQWPFITTDYLEGGNLQRFYPTSVLETGADILRPWVARMIMLGLYSTDTIPFHDVFLHGLILDQHGQKMSKSKGNVINPMDIVGEFGSDALRIGVVMNRSAGQAQAFSTASVIAGRNFCNKLWNIARFIEDKSDHNFTREEILSAKPKNINEHWILAKLDAARENLDNHIANYRFAEAIDTIYHCIWDDLADWFIESSKTKIHTKFLYRVLDICLRLAHPFAPFVTETIWTALNDSDSSLLISQKWPEKLEFDEFSANQFDRIKELVLEIRYVTSSLPNKKYDLLYENDILIHENSELIKTLANLESITQIDQPRGLKIASANREAWLDLEPDLVYEHQTKLELRLVEIRADIAKLKQRLSNENYISKAPEKLVDETRRDLIDKEKLEKRLIAELDVIEK